MKPLNMIAVVVLSGMVTCGFAADVAKSSESKSASVKSIQSSKTQTTEGTISALDVKANTLALSTADGKSTDVSIKGASVWKAGKKVTAADLKVGDAVSVRHVTKNGKQVAKSIEIK